MTSSVRFREFSQSSCRCRLQFKRLCDTQCQHCGTACSKGQTISQPLFFSKIVQEQYTLSNDIWCLSSEKSSLWCKKTGRSNLSDAFTHPQPNNQDAPKSLRHAYADGTAFLCSPPGGVRVYFFKTLPKRHLFGNLQQSRWDLNGLQVSAARQYYFYQKLHILRTINRLSYKRIGSSISPVFSALEAQFGSVLTEFRALIMGF